MVMAEVWLRVLLLLLMQRADKSLRCAGCQKLTSFVNSSSQFCPRDVQLWQDMEESREKRWGEREKKGAA